MTVRDTAPSTPLVSLTLPRSAGRLCAVAWEPGGNKLVAVTSTGWVLLWETSTGVLLHQKQITRAPLLSVAWARQERCLAVGCQNGTLRMLDEDLFVHATYPFPTAVTRLAWAPHIVGACLIVAGTSVTLVREERRTPLVLQYQRAVVDATWSGDGRQMAILCADGVLEIWQARTRRLVQRFLTEPIAESSLQWDQACRTVAIAEPTGTLQWYPLTHLPPSPFPTPPLLTPVLWGTHRAVQDPSGRYLATASPYTVQLYAVSSLMLPPTCL